MPLPHKCCIVILCLFFKTNVKLLFCYSANQHFCPSFIFTHTTSLCRALLGHCLAVCLSTCQSFWLFSPSCAWLVPQRNRNLCSNLIILPHSAELQVSPQSRLDYAALYVQLCIIGFFIQLLLCYKTFKLISNEIMALLSTSLMIT